MQHISHTVFSFVTPFTKIATITTIAITIITITTITITTTRPDSLGLFLHEL